MRQDISELRARLQAAEQSLNQSQGSIENSQNQANALLQICLDNLGNLRTVLNQRLNSVIEIDTRLAASRESIDQDFAVLEELLSET